MSEVVLRRLGETRWCHIGRQTGTQFRRNYQNGSLLVSVEGEPKSFLPPALFIMLEQITNLGTNGMVYRRGQQIVLQNEIKDMYISFMKIVFEKFNPIFQSLWQRDVSDGGIQIANYNPRTIQQTSWHHDFSADISVVVPLNTGSYKGGGTEFFHQDLISKSEKGKFVLFPPDWTFMHRGEPCKKEKMIVTGWWNFEEQK